MQPAISDSEPLAALYGRADHLKRQDVLLTFGDRVALTLRALYLLAAFAPFLLLGVPLLLIAACLPARPEPEVISALGTNTSTTNQLQIYDCFQSHQDCTCSWRQSAP